MRKKSSVLLIALLTSTGLAMAAGNDGAGLLGPDPTAVTGAQSSGAATDQTPDDKGQVIGAGVSGARGEEANSSGEASGGQGDGAGTAYIDCPGNAFTSGIRNDPEGRDCVPPDSLVIQGSDNRTRDSMTENLPQGIGSSARGSTGANNAATQRSGNQGNDLGTGDNTTGTANTMGASGSTADAGDATGSTGTTSGATGGTGGMNEGTTGGISGSGPVGGTAGAGNTGSGASGGASGGAVGGSVGGS